MFSYIPQSIQQRFIQSNAGQGTTATTTTPPTTGVPPKAKAKIKSLDLKGVSSGSLPTTTASTKVKAPGKSSTVAEAEEMQRGIIASMAEPLFQVELPPGIFDPPQAELQVNQEQDSSAMDTTNVATPDLLSDFDIISWAPPAHQAPPTPRPRRRFLRRN